MMRNTDDWLEVHREAANRRRRVMYNNDGDDVCLAAEPTPESILAVRTTGIEGTHVDTYVHSTLSNFTSCVHNSRVAELHTTRDPSLLSRSNIQTLIDQGLDSLTLIIDFCRAHGIEVFWSARLNDMHDNWYPWMMTEFKKKHLDLCLWRDGDYGRPGDGTIEPHMYASAMDFGHETIRRRQYDTVIDVCERYDIDGVELDFMREPVYFRPNMEGRPVEPEHLALMTGFVREIREKADEIGQKRGKPILMSARVPNLLDRCRYIGLDVEQWVAERLLDMIVPSLEFTPFTGDFTEMAALAHDNGMSVYPCIGGGVGGLACWAAAATNALASGADGIATFNLFDPHFPAWRVIGDQAALGAADKLYAVDDIRGAMTTHTHVIDRRPLLPITITPGAAARVILPVREDLGAGAGAATLRLTMLLEQSAFGDKVELTLNGVSLEPEITVSAQGRAPLAVGKNTYTAEVDASTLICGDNLIRVAVTRIEPRQADPIISDLRLHVSRRALAGDGSD